MNNKLLVILGPTATGKTDVGLRLAKQLNGELVSCDSRQVYKGLDLGTGKMPGKDVPVKKHNLHWQIDGVNVWMYDVVSPSIQYTVADYVKDANQVIEKINKKDKLPIIVGGTGLYLKALLEGISNLNIPIDLALREEINKLSLPDLQSRLQQVSPQSWEKMNNSDRNNKRRLVRYIELSYMYPYGNKSTGSILHLQQSDVLKIGLTASREDLYRRINLRVLSRIKQGMILEAKKLYQEGLSLERMKQLGLEYGVLANYLQGSLTEAGLIAVMQNKIHQYAKRQITWFKREKEVYWFDITKPLFFDEVEKTVTSWYHKRNDKKD